MITGKQAILLTVLSTAVLLATSCNRQRKTLQAHQHVLRENADAFLKGQLRHPSSVGGPSNSDFIHRTYLPGIENARRSLSKLESGEINLVPIAGFVRTFRSKSLLWITWMQRDEKPRTVMVQDKDGPFARFVVPTDGDFSTYSSTYMRVDSVTLTPANADLTWKENASPPVPVKRAFDPSSVHVSFLKTDNGTEHEEGGMNVPLYPLPTDDAAPTAASSPTTSKAANGG